ncbi:CoA pyrophosphatase [Chryseotalea sanaruensis]|uniref:CoA pyrophosphatase n=1 Tax=Chryseotalea sanaruensis TaxID=2482724 RepID=A0A401U9G8_9BACT|nr:CoA pyrophosphatase [Chryseotalea sanaruensis]GCC51527.1 CoA pyrophosphatase [Chryseotalea sanaruensis]
MTLDQLTNYLTKRLQAPLPGVLAHEPLRARPNGSIIPDFTHKLPPKPGSVLILLYEENGNIKFPLIKRPQYLGAHSGQVSLPGGKAEAGETIIETALREGEEEIGIHASQVKVIGQLSEFFVMPSNFMVTPVIGFLEGSPQFKADPYEVERILQADMQDLLRTDAIREKEILAAGRFQMWAPHFEVEHEIVWGATAMMLNEFRMVIEDINH